jgi:hypothetical protein
MNRCLMVCAVVAQVSMALRLGAAPGSFFTPNRGQAPGPVLYVMQSQVLSAGFRADGIDFRVGGSVVSLHYDGGRAKRVEGLDRLHGRVNILAGSRAARWQTDIPAYAALIYRDLYPGIDAVYDGRHGLKCEFRVAPHADPFQIRLRYSGVDHIEIDPGGALALRTKSGILREDAPEIYQTIAGAQRSVSGAFRLIDRVTVAFDLGEYDASQPLIIDPVISSSTYFGRGGIDVATAVATDAAGNIYLAGWTDSGDLTSSRLGSAWGVNAFVAKFQSDGRTLVYCTYLGGSGDDRATALAVDGAGNVVIAGSTNSRDFPTAYALQSSLRGSSDAFVARLDASGARLLSSTYFGGDGSDAANGLALDAAGNIYIAGETTSSNAFRTGASYQAHAAAGSDAFVIKLNSAGTSIVYAAFLGGAGADRARAVAISASGEAYVAGDTTSADFPAMNGFQRSLGGGQDAFVAKLNATGAGLIFSTYLGGSGGATGYPESASSIAVDTSGNAYIAGSTSSKNFPVVSAYPAAFGGGLDAFVAKISGTGALIYSAYLGGGGIDAANAIAVSLSGTVYVAGYSTSTDFSGAAQTNSKNHGLYDAFVAQVKDGKVVESTYIGGSDADAANAIALHAGDELYVAGQTTSRDLSVTDAFQTSAGGLLDAFLVHVTLSDGLLFVPVTPCRVVDTRMPAGPFGGPALSGGGSRNFSISSGSCGISADALAYSLNVTVVPHGTLGYLTVWPAGQARPVASTLNSMDGRVKANAVIVPAGSNGAISAYVTDAADIIIDVNGYFVPQGTSGALAFYPVTPCRVMDTRQPAGSLGGPTLLAGQARQAPIRDSQCGLPDSVSAYVLNFTAIPQNRHLDYLSVWPSGSPMPLVSTLNAPTGTITANTAIVPAGTGGAITLYATDATDLAIDLYGYFAPPGPGGLSFYGITPCRAVDTRGPSGPLGGPALSGQRDLPLGSSGCTPSNAAAYFLNATVAPHEPLGYLSIWPTGQYMPVVSMLNAIDGAVTSNAAIVTASNQSIAVFATNWTDLILDITGYFAQ